MNFSKLRPIHHQAPFNTMSLLAPPYKARANRILNLMQWLYRRLG
ncbi:hypothetical protein [Marinobacter sp. NP-4(2019)]|nr:hypothetical protein [Marinobacter sp. NP-4(2019)]